MPIDLKQLREPAPATNHLHGQAKEVVDFLGREPEKAYTFREIGEEVATVRGTNATLPWNPLLVGFRAFTLAATLEEMGRSGLVVRGRNVDSLLYYHLSERARSER